MTTIAWKPPYMACDGRVTVGTHVFTEKCSKVYKLTSGGLMGFSGALDSRPIVKFFDNVKTPKGFPEPKQLIDCKIDFRSLLVLPNETVWLVECGPEYQDTDGEKIKEWAAYITQINEHHIAVGSGRMWAKGAMDFGASAEQAVKIAMKNDTMSGGKVQVFKLEPKISKTKKVIK